MQISLLEAIDIIKSDSENIKKVLQYYGVETSKGNVLCPFHSDKHPSMGLKGGRYKCFTCKASGDSIDFIRFKEGTDVLGATKKALEILGLDYTIEKNKLDKLREYIENNNKTWYADKSYLFEDVHFYLDSEGVPKLVRIKFKNKETNKKQYSQANIVDKGDYYSLDFKSEKVNLLYNMPIVVKSIQENKEIFLVEGEKDADNLKRLGLAATTCREINSATDEVLRVLEDAKLVVIGDNDDTGKKHINNVRYKLLNRVRSFKNPMIKELCDLGNKSDISDFIESKFEEGLSTKQIRKIILDQVNRTLDEKDDNELQQNTNGVFYTFKKYDNEGELVEERKIYLTNFKIERLTRIENIDTDEEEIELTLKSNLNEVKTVKGRSNKIFLDPKSFNSFMNMGFSFDGKSKDFTRFKNWVNKYFLYEKRNEYLLTGIRVLDGKKMLITPNGGVLENGKIDTNYKANNPLT
ncbi:MAG: CHC2 zinc finger domain-containing protein, partial [Brevinema sp.]